MVSQPTPLSTWMSAHAANSSAATARSAPSAGRQATLGAGHTAGVARLARSRFAVLIATAGLLTACRGDPSASHITGKAEACFGTEFSRGVNLLVVLTQDGYDVEAQKGISPMRFQFDVGAGDYELHSLVQYGKGQVDETPVTVHAVAGQTVNVDLIPECSSISG